jgi:hypothetical protein
LKEKEAHEKEEELRRTNPQLLELKRAIGFYLAEYAVYS